MAHAAKVELSKTDANVERKEAGAVIVADEKALELVNDNTKIIPGHGPLAVKADLIKAQEMLKTIQKRVKEEIMRGATLENIIVKNILADYAEYSSFIDKDNMVKIAHRSIAQN